MNIDRKQKLNEIRDYISNLGMVVVKEIPEHEVFIVNSKEYGFKNMVIDMENEVVVFKLQLGHMKDSFEPIDGKEVSRWDVEKEFAKFGNPLYDPSMITGQFTWDEKDDNILVFVEQERLSTLNFEVFKNTISDISNILVDKIDFIQYATVNKKEVK